MKRALVSLIFLIVAAAPASRAQQPQPPYEFVYVQKESGAIGEVSIHASRADGSGAKLVSNERSAVFEPNAWAPKGDRIVFSSIRDADETLADDCRGYSNRALYGMTVDDKKGEVSPPERLTTLLTVGGISWSPDGSKLAFSSVCEDPKRIPRKDSGYPAIYVMDMATRKVQRLTEWGPYGWPSWSPDGKRIAFDGRDPGSTEMGIHVMDADGKNPKRIEDGIRPRWAPKGDRIAYMRSTALFVVGTDGTGRKHLEVLESGTDYSWSPDGASLVVGSREAEVVDVTTGARTYLGAPGMDRDFSADGKSILITRSDTLFSIDPTVKPPAAQALIKLPARTFFNYGGFAKRPKYEPGK